jgi:hypothetical protein
MDKGLVDRIRTWLEGNPLSGAAIALVAGLIVGWLALGWWLFPVRWVNAPPADMQTNYKEHYVAMVADSYSLSQDLDVVKARLASFEEEELARIMGNLVHDYTEADLTSEAQRVQALARVLKVTPVAVSPTAVATPQPRATPSPAATQPSAVAPARSLGQRLRFIGGIFLLALLIITAGIAAFIWYTRTRASRPEETSGARWRGGGQVTLGRSVFATYTLGQKDYRESFLIYDEEGELVGECGLHASEVIGEGEPSQVTAFDISLFDKEEMRTAARVLASEHAYHDEAIRLRLELTGEVAPAERGRIISLETPRLHLEAEVVDFAYGMDAFAPPHSIFERLTVALRPTKREMAGERDQPLSEPLA